MKRWICALLALMLCMTAAAAVAEETPIYVHCTGDVNVRALPNLGGKQMEVAKAGDVWTYLFNASVDERGVVWYMAGDGDTIGWISSKYSELTCGDTVLIYDTRNLEGLVLADNVLRGAPDTLSDEMASFRAGDPVRYLNLYADLGGKMWYYVECGNAWGWMSDRYVEMQYGD